jgi:hypothetical protein
MTKRTRVFFVSAAAVLALGVGTAIFAALTGVQSAPSGLVQADLEYVPADAQVLAFANVREVMDSDLRRNLAAFQGGAGDHANSFQEETGIDLERDVDHVLVSLAGGDNNERPGGPLVLVRGRFAATRLEGAATSHGATAEDYRGTRILVHGDSGMTVAFAEPELVALGPGAVVRRALDTKGSGGNVTGNAEVMGLVSDVDDGNAWAVAKLDALSSLGALPAPVASQMPALSWFTASGHVNGGLSGRVRAQARDEKSAEDLRDVVRGLIALARLQTSSNAEVSALVNSLQLTAEGTTVSLSFSVPSELFNALGTFVGRSAQPRQAPEPNAP